MHRAGWAHEDGVGARFVVGLERWRHARATDRRSATVADPGRADRRPTGSPCPRCGCRYERLRDPLGRWSVCARCGFRSATAAGEFREAPAIDPPQAGSSRREG